MARQRDKRWVFTLVVSLLIILGIGSFSLAAKRMTIREDIISSSQQESPLFESIIFGYSEQGRAMEGYTFGNGADRLLLIAGLHGTEKGATGLLERFATELRENPELVSPEKQVIILPVANPDGYYTREDKLNVNGVNLNRNFATAEWSQYQEGIFGGTQPFSEVESRVIKNMIEEYEPTMMIAFHSQGALTVPETAHAASIALAKWYADKTGYTYFDEWDYSGTATGWFTETTGNPSLTVELSNHFESDWNINKDALLELISQTVVW